jgi:hypothetical protein
MSTIVSLATHASRVKFLEVVNACGHTVEVKVSPSISAAYIREIRREAKRLLCAGCRAAAANKARQEK